MKLSIALFVALLFTTSVAKAQVTPYQTTNTCSYTFVVPNGHGTCPGSPASSYNLNMRIKELQDQLREQAQIQEVLLQRLVVVESQHVISAKGDHVPTTEGLVPPGSTYAILGCPTSLYARVMFYVPIGPGEIQVYPTTVDQRFSLPISAPPFHILCSTDNWIVVQARHNGLELNFNRTWHDYATGFGNFNNEFWLGLDKMHQITANRFAKYTLRFEGRRDDGLDVAVEYLDVRIASKEEGYKLTYEKRGQSTRGYGNLFSGPFHAMSEPSNVTHPCTKTYNAWWYRSNACVGTDLNFNAPTPFWDRSIKLAQTKMKLKPVFA